MAEIAVKKVQSKDRAYKKRDLYATVCYYYPQYTLQQVQKLPARDVQLLLEVAHRIQAQNMYTLTQIAAAPHSKGGKGVEKLLDHFKKIGKF